MPTFLKKATHRAMTKPSFFPQTCQPQGLATLLVLDYVHQPPEEVVLPPILQRDSRSPATCVRPPHSLSL